MKTCKKVFAGLLMLAIMVTCLPFHMATANAQTARTDVDAVVSAAAYNYNNEEGAFTYGYEWHVIILGRSTNVSNANKEKYYNSIVAKIKENGSTKLKSGSYESPAENAKVILALSALGYDARNIDGYDLVTPLVENNCAWGIGNGIYQTPFILMALTGFDNQYSAEKELLINTIATYQDANDGGVYGSYESGGIEYPYDNYDGAGYMIQALAPYYNSNATAKDVIDKIINWVSPILGNSGGVENYDGSVNAESTSQLLIGLASAGIDVQTDSRFVKSNGTMIDAIQTYYAGNGTYTSTYNPVMTTEQAVSALIAYQRMLDGKTGIYNISDTAKVDSIEITVPDGKIEELNNTKGITVETDSNGNVTKIKMDVASMENGEISLSNLFAISAMDAANQTITVGDIAWTSSDETVAAVETRTSSKARTNTEYVLVAKKNGSTTITLSASNASTSFGLEVTGIKTQTENDGQQSENGGTTITTVPTTGDATPIIMLAVLAAVAAAGTVATRRRKSRI